MTASSAVVATGDLHLERLRWWHLPDVLALERGFGADAWSEQTWWSELGQVDDRACLAAVDADGRVAGYAVLALLGDEADVQTFAVDPSRRRSGVGGALLAALLRAGVERGVRDVHLEVRADNDPALALYRRFGFTAAGRRRGYYQEPGAEGAPVDAVLMVLRDVPARTGVGAS